MIKIIVRVSEVVLLIVAIAITLKVLALNAEFIDRDNKIKRCYKIYNRLVKAANQSAPKLLIEQNNGINSYASLHGRIIVLYTGFIDYAKNDDELALLIGHELSHYILEHKFFPIVSVEDSIQNKKEELNADKLGAFLMLQAGYDVCKARYYWKRFFDTRPDIVENPSHPENIYRFYNLNMPWCQ